MASRKKLKKSIHDICDILLIECIALSSSKDSKTAAVAHEVAEKSVALRNDFISRLSHTEPNDAHKYYTQLIKQFTESVQSLSGKLLSEA